MYALIRVNRAASWLRDTLCPRANALQEIICWIRRCHPVDAARIPRREETGDARGAGVSCSVLKMLARSPEAAFETDNWLYRLQFP